MADRASEKRGPGPAAEERNDAPTVGDALEAVRDALEDIEYGSVLIKVHQGAVVGIETSTKLRLKGS